MAIHGDLKRPMFFLAAISSLVMSSSYAADPVIEKDMVASDKFQKYWANDLKITLSANPNPVDAGGPLSYMMVVSYKTIAIIPEAKNVKAKVLFPEGIVQFVSSQDCTWGTEFPPSKKTFVSCEFGDIKSGIPKSASFIVLTSPSAKDSVTANASVEAGFAKDDYNGNNSITVVTKIAEAAPPPSGADVGLTMISAGPEPLTAGSSVSYFATITNFGPDAANNVDFTESGRGRNGCRGWNRNDHHSS